jgi:hypothetical protein
LEVETITDAYYTGDKEAVKKLIITGTISGNDYSDSSEWSKLYFLDTTFQNIEEVGIWSDQDIPTGNYADGSLFARYPFGLPLVYMDQN